MDKQLCECRREKEHGKVPRREDGFELGLCRSLQAAAMGRHCGTNLLSLWFGVTFGSH